MQDARSKASKQIDLRFSLGITIDKNGDGPSIVDVVPGSPADKAGVGPSMKVLGVNGRKFDDELLKEAIAATPKTKQIELLLENASYFINAKLEYDGGVRAPHLERAESAADLIGKIVEPRAK
jgi:predicted metalloprotease with PDZ domain